MTPPPNKKNACTYQSCWQEELRSEKNKAIENFAAYQVLFLKETKYTFALILFCELFIIYYIIGPLRPKNSTQNIINLLKKIYPHDVGAI